MKGLLGLAMAVLAGCSCDAGHSFVLIIPGAAEPERAWITPSLLYIEFSSINLIPVSSLAL